jgi:RND family efflux transporter MFP subunit
MQALPVHTMTIALTPVPQTSEYVATIKSRRSATIMPQATGNLTRILVKSGDRVKAGQPLMEIDSRPQTATVASLRATERQKKALYDYNVQQYGRQKQLFDAGIISRDLFDQARQSIDNAKADYEAAQQSRKTQEQQLGYYTVRAPMAGIVGDIPVHVGDLVSPSSSTPITLTTIDEGKDLEAYIYIPTERYAQIRNGLEVELTDTTGKLIETSKIDFVSPQVDTNLQGILVKTPVRDPRLRTDQMVKARVIWSESPMAVVPVLAVKRLGIQSFVYLLQQQNGRFSARQTGVVLGDAVGNNYSIVSGVKPGDKVIVSGTQFLLNDMPVVPLNQ